MRKNVFIVLFLMLACGNTNSFARSVVPSAEPLSVVAGGNVTLTCTWDGKWKPRVIKANITIFDANSETVISEEEMSLETDSAGYVYPIPLDASEGEWSYNCRVQDRRTAMQASAHFTVTSLGGEQTPPGDYIESPIPAHNQIVEYNGPSTCITCHKEEAEEMLDSLHMKWSGPTPDLTNSSGEELGKATKGINTFCTYAMSSKSACFSCHVRADGNAPHAPEAEDVDCLMCHSETYQRKFVADPEATETVTNINGETKTYVFGAVDELGNYITVPDFDKMPPGIRMVDVARSVTMPTKASCLRCHGKAGGGDWTKRGDLGMSSAHPTFDEDVHLAPDGANLDCVNCHSALNHKIAGRGIDLRQTEAPPPTCAACHTSAPHIDSTLNKHAQGQVSCQVCHIREFGKGGSTEMSRDWLSPVWNPAFCSGQGGFVGHEVKESFVKPEYVWFDGSSYVYNIGETIRPDKNGVYHMAEANGEIFDGKSSIVPIKRHFTVMPLHQSGKIIPPVIMSMFMTGDFDIAVRKGMEEQGMTGSYTIVEADAEMMINHGVDPKERAPSCIECHDNSGSTPDGSGMMPFGQLGYHNVPNAVRSCSLCHSSKNMQWQNMHTKHENMAISCKSCHTSEPLDFVEPRQQLCSTCHELKSWNAEGHKKHLEKKVECKKCHIFS